MDEVTDILVSKTIEELKKYLKVYIEFHPNVSGVNSHKIEVSLEIDHQIIHRDYVYIDKNELK